VRTLLDKDNTNRPDRRTALIGRELNRYNIDIAALSETRLVGKAKSVKKVHGIHFIGSEEEMKKDEKLGSALLSKHQSLEN
jgi:hypothetical protein